MSSVDRIANQMLHQERRIGALERSRSLSKSALVNASIPVYTGDDGDLTLVGYLGKPLFDDLTDMAQVLEESRQRLDTELGEMNENLERAAEIIASAETDIKAAQDAANQAAVDAASAKADVQDAIDAAHSVEQTAADALAKAEAAQASVATAEQAAQKAAADAQDVADDLAALAGKTGRVIRSDTAPSGSDANENNLWLDPTNGTIHNWDGTQWQEITDPAIAEAANKADQAYNLADNAQEAAAQAASLAEAANTLATSATTEAENAQASALAANSEAQSAKADALAAQQAAIAAMSNGGNLVPNGDFLDGLTGWTGAAITTGTADDGVMSNDGLSRSMRSATFGVTPEGTYRVEIRTRGEVDGVVTYVQFSWRDASGAALSVYHAIRAQAITTEWDVYSGDAVAPAGAQSTFVTVFTTHPIGASGVQDVDWVRVTDVTASASASEAAEAAMQEAVAAKAAADQAEAKALAAQKAADDAAAKATTADGRVTVATANPTTSDALGKPEGAIWEVRSGTSVPRRYMLVGGTWTQVKIGQDFIGDNAIGTAQILDAAIGTAKIADLAVTDAKIGSLNVAKLVADTARMNQLAVEKIIGDAAYFNALQANKIVVAGDPTNQVDAITLADGAVTTPKLYVSEDMWTKILTVAGDATVGGNLIVNDTIDATKLRVDELFAQTIAGMMATFQEAFIGKLSAQTIISETFQGYRVEGAEIVSPGDAGNITIADNTMVVQRNLPDGDGSQVTMRLGGSESDQFSLTPAGSSEATVFMDGDSGDANFAGNVSMNDLRVGGMTLSEMLDPRPRGIIGMTWGSGAALPDIGTYSYGLVRFTWAVESYRRYLFGADVKVQGTPGDKIQFTLHHSAADGPAGINSTVLSVWYYEIPVGGVGSFHLERPIQVSYSHPDYNVLLSMRNSTTSSRPVRLWSDSGSNQSQSYFWVEDMGKAVSEASSEWVSGVGRTFGDTVAPPPPAPTKRTYTKTYQASGAWSWRSGSLVWDSLQHGEEGGAYRQSQILFPPSAVTDLEGATLLKARLKMRNTHTWYGSGMTALISSGSQSSQQTSPPTSATNQSVKWGRGETKFVTLNNFAKGQRSIWLGIGAPGGREHFGRFSRTLSDLVLELTYEK